MAEPAVVRMANDIARQLAHLDADEAASTLAAHLTMFWEPRMRRELLAEVQRDPAQVASLVVRAVSLVTV
jgi:formate dehydrogenase subunit delta